MSTQLQRFEQARIGLTAAVMEHGQAVAGFRPWQLSEAAPDTLPGILAAWNAPEPFPIWSGGSDKTVYLTPLGNTMFRLWHDWLHVTYDLETTLADELVLSAIHVDSVIHRGKDVALLMYIDTACQSLYERQHGHFPDDQLGFAYDKWKELT